ncbi:NADPH-dependent F420 reductase [Curtobacterium sp. USHLN213]|uniref:NADPH-dependent F420 reductase n=1 Tax=Curtobacterium sp. USHLN213 TaxID=3081255 RepID=UPI0030194EF5
MKIAILGTGMVGRTLAAKLVTLNHEVALGTRNVEQTLARTDADQMGNAPLSQWLQDNTAVQVRAFADVATDADLVINATSGQVSLDVLASVGSEDLAGKPLVDVALPLDLSEGMPPTLTVANQDSLAEQIQRAYPDAKVVKTLNTVFAGIMVAPETIPGHHNIFVSGDDAAAKQTVVELLASFGWPTDAIIDLGGITSARGAEMYSRLFFQLTGLLNTWNVNIAIVHN